MEEIQRIKLLGSQKILLREKSLRIQEALQSLRRKEVALQETLNIIMGELGVSKEDVL